MVSCFAFGPTENAQLYPQTAFSCSFRSFRLLLKCTCQRFWLDYSEDVWLASKSYTSDGTLQTSISLEAQGEKCCDSGYQECFQYR